jgi:small subunit ribosomal protein S4e
MSKKHLKRLNIPKTWDIKKKGIKYIKRPNPGAHTFNQGISLSVFLRDISHTAKTNKEVKNILNNHEVLIDGIRRKEVKFIVGFMDIITIPSTKQNLRITINNKGKLSFIDIDEKESKLKVCRIKTKTMSKKGIQLGLSDGRSIILKDKKECKVGDSALIELPSQNIKEIIKLEKGSLIFLVGGKHNGSTATIQNIKDKTMTCKNQDLKFETSKKYAYVIGKEKPVIKVQE